MFLHSVCCLFFSITSISLFSGSFILSSLSADLLLSPLSEFHLSYFTFDTKFSISVNNFYPCINICLFINIVLLLYFFNHGFHQFCEQVYIGYFEVFF